jgi:hypothetical protein
MEHALEVLAIEGRLELAHDAHVVTSWAAWDMRHR